MAACAAVTLPRFLLDSTDSIQRMGVLWSIGLTMWWGAPLALLVTSARSAVLRRVGPVAYLAVASLVLAAVYRDTSSTAAFGLFFVPLYLVVAVGVALGVELAVMRGSRRNR